MADATFDIGRMRHRITVMRKGPTVPNASGQAKPPYAPVGTYYALVEQIAGDKPEVGDQIKGVRKYRITARATFTVLPTDQILWSGRTLSPEPAIVDSFGAMQTIEAAEKVAPQ